MELEFNESMVALTADVVSAYIAHNPVPIAELPSLIEQVHKTMEGLRGVGKPAEPSKKAAAVPVKKSVSHGHITCLEDGKKFKSLKRHLATSHGMTPEEYRERWSLPRDYPMLAPAYAEERSRLALEMGLGRKADKKKAEAKRKKSQVPVSKPRGRARKTA